MSSEIVVTEKLTKQYGARTVVDSVDLAVREGEIYGFLGPNGAGKTTTLRMLVGLVAPTSGRASMFGLPPADRAAARRTGVLIESPGFYPYLSGFDNLRVLSRLRGLPVGAASAALERVGLSDRRDDRFRTYSMGMKQRLGVAAALLGEPELLILDEPTNGLDPAGVVDMRTLTVDLARDGHTVILSSHMLDEVQEVCDRVGVVSDGVLLTESTVSALRGASRLFVRADPVASVGSTLRNLLGHNMVEKVDGGYRVSVSPLGVPEVARTLVENEIDIHELTQVERTLEDAFFEITGGRSR